MNTSNSGAPSTLPSTQGVRPEEAPPPRPVRDWRPSSARLRTPRWPDGAQCVVLLTVNFDADSVDLHECSEANLYGRFSYGRYGMRAGLERVLDAFAATGTRATFFVPGLDAERQRPQIDAVLAGGHEIAARGYAFEDFSRLAERERETLEKAHVALEKATGRAPTGFRAPRGLVSPKTLEHLAALGYAYDATFEDDDWPYLVDAGEGRVVVELPAFEPLRDSTFYEPRHSHTRVAKVWREEFDAQYAEGVLVTLSIHPRGDYGSGRPPRARVVQEFIEHAASRPGVRFMTCSELAAWWRVHQPDTLEPLPPG
jgi:peptidoglycan/xylan/chitin deacetylase (PgdA/CDA1 family)